MSKRPSPEQSRTSTLHKSEQERLEMEQQIAATKFDLDTAKKAIEEYQERKLYLNKKIQELNTKAENFFGMFTSEKPRSEHELCQTGLINYDRKIQKQNRVKNELQEKLRMQELELEEYKKNKELEKNSKKAAQEIIAKQEAMKEKPKLSNLTFTLLDGEEKKREEGERKETERKRELQGLKSELETKISSVRSTYKEVEKLEQEFKTGLKQTLSAKQQKVISNILKDLLQNITAKPHLYDDSNPTHKARLVLISLIEDNAKKIKLVVATMYQILQMIYHPALHEAHFASSTSLDPKIESKLGEIQGKMADEGVKESKDLQSEKNTLEALQLNAKRQQEEWQQLMFWLEPVTEEAKGDKTISVPNQAQILKKEFEKLQKSLTESAASYDAIIPDRIKEVKKEIKKLQGEEKILADSTSMFLRDDKNAVIKMAVETCKIPLGNYLNISKEKSVRRQLLVDLQSFFHEINYLIMFKKPKSLIPDTSTQVRNDNQSEIKNVSAPQDRRPILTVMQDLYQLSGRSKKQALLAAQAFGKVLNQPIAPQSILNEIQIGSLENESLQSIEELKGEIVMKDIRTVAQDYKTERALGTVPITLVLDALQIWKNFIEEEAQKEEGTFYLLDASKAIGREKAGYLKTIAKSLDSIILNLNDACIPFREKIKQMESIRADLVKQMDMLNNSLNTSRVQGTQEQLATLAESLRLPALPISSHAKTMTNNKFSVVSQAVTVRTQLDQLYQELTAELLGASSYGVDSQISTVINVLGRLEENLKKEVKPFESKLALDSLTPALQAIYSVEKGSAEEVFYTNLEKIMTGWRSKTKAIDEELSKLGRLEDQKRPSSRVSKVIQNWMKSASQTTQMVGKQRNSYTLLVDALQEYRGKYAEEDKTIELDEKAQLLEKAKSPEKTRSSLEVKKDQMTKGQQLLPEVKQSENKEAAQDNRTFMEKFTADSKNTKLEIKEFLTRQEDAISNLEDKIAHFLENEWLGWQVLWANGDFELETNPVNPNSQNVSTLSHKIRPVTPNSTKFSTPSYESRSRGDSIGSRTSGGSRGSQTDSNNESKESTRLNEIADRIKTLFAATIELRNLKSLLKSNSSGPVEKDPEEEENKTIDRLKTMEWDRSLLDQALEFLKSIPGFEKEGVEFLLSLESNKIADITPKGKFYQIFFRWRQNKSQNGDLLYLTEISKSDKLSGNNFLVQLLNPSSDTFKRIKDSKGEKNETIKQNHADKLQSLLNNWREREFFELKNAIKGVENEAIQLLDLLIENKALNAIIKPFYKKFITKLLACKENVGEKRQIVVNAIHQYLYEWTTQVIGDINLYRSKCKKIPSESAHKITYLLEICRKAQVLSEELSMVQKNTEALRLEREQQIKNLTSAKESLQNKMQEVNESKESSLPQTTGLEEAIHQFSRRVRRKSNSLLFELRKKAPMRETSTTGTICLPAEIKLPTRVRVSEFKLSIPGVDSFCEMKTVQQGLPKFNGFFEFANQSFDLIGSEEHRPPAEFKEFQFPVVTKNQSSVNSTSMDAQLAAQLQRFGTSEQAEQHVMTISLKDFEKELKDLQSEVLAGLARMLFEKVGQDKDIEEAKRLSLAESAIMSKTLLEKVARDYQYVCANVPGDDHCFFYALARQLELMPTNGKTSTKVPLTENGELKGDFTSQRDVLRRQSSDELINNKLYYNGIFDVNYLKQLKTNGWGDLGAAKLLINAWARQSQPRAIVIVPHDGSPIQICRAAGATEVLVIGNQVGMHFQSLESKATLKGLASDKLCQAQPQLELIACYQNYNREISLNVEDSKELPKIRLKVKNLLSDFYKPFDLGFTRQLEEDLQFLEVIKKNKTTLTPAQELEIELLTSIKEERLKPSMPTLVTITPGSSPKKPKPKKPKSHSSTGSSPNTTSSSNSSSSAVLESTLTSSSNSNSSSSTSSSSNSSSSTDSIIDNFSLGAANVVSTVTSILTSSSMGIYQNAERSISSPKSPLLKNSLFASKNNNAIEEKTVPSPVADKESRPRKKKNRPKKFLKTVAIIEEALPTSPSSSNLGNGSHT